MNDRQTAAFLRRDNPKNLTVATRPDHDEAWRRYFNAKERWDGDRQCYVADCVDCTLPVELGETEGRFEPFVDRIDEDGEFVHLRCYAHRNAA